MPQIAAAIALNNGAATPVAVSFTPEVVSPTQVTFVDRSSGTSLGYKRLTFTFSPATAKRATTRVGITFSFPEVATVSGVPTLVHTARYQNGEFIIPETMSLASRADLRAFVANACNLPLANSMVKDLETAW